MKLAFRLRIALLSATVSGIVLMAFGGFSLYLAYQQRIQAVDRELRTLSMRHPGWFANRGNYGRLNSVLAYTFGEQRQDEVAVAIVDAWGTNVFQSPHWPASISPLELIRAEDLVAPRTASATNAPPFRTGFGGGFGRGAGPPEPTLTATPRFFSRATTGVTWRFGLFRATGSTVVIGMNLNAVRRELVPLRNAFLITFPVALLAVALGGWLISGYVLRPIRSIADTAENVTARGLDRRIPVSREAPEITRLIEMLNRMMDRLQASFHQAIRFSADASHELKTPLTIMQGELEHGLQMAPNGSTEQQLLNRLLEQTERLKTTTRTLLLLSQADAGEIKLSLSTVDLSHSMQDLMGDARALGAEARIGFDAQIEAGIFVEADPLLLQCALFNVLTNAVKFNEPDGAITLRLRREHEFAALEVSNSGPGIPPSEQPRLFERFYRGAGNRRTEGSGLGLSLAREILRAHGGDVMLVESRPGSTTFVVRIKTARSGQAVMGTA